MTGRLQRIVIDLTPIIPGGENGGAKVFILELVDQLAGDHPETQFLLLIHARAELELQSLAKDNVHLVVASGQNQGSITQPLPIRAAKWLIKHLPNRLAALSRGLAFRAGRALHRGKPAPYRGGMGLVRQLEADLLFCPFTAPSFWDPAIPTVSTIHDLQYKTYPQFFEPAEVTHRDRLFREAVRYSTLLTAVSDYSRDSAIEHGRMTQDKIRTIHHRLAQRVDFHQTIRGDDDLNPWGLTPKRFLIYPANFWPHKNHEMLLTGFSMAVRSGLPADLQLVLTGAPCERQEFLIQATKKMGLEGRVVFPGYVSNKQLSGLLQSSLGMLFPSLYEGFGMPVIEAMAMGIPVASSKSASLLEIAGEAALLFDARKPQEIQNAIESLVESPSLRQALIDEGKKRASVFSDRQGMAHAYWDTFETALIRHGTEYRVTGPYADGWLDSVASIETSRQTGPSELVIKVSSPNTNPHPRNRIDLDINGRISQSFWIQRGRSRTLKVPLEPGRSVVDLFITPTFDSSGFNPKDDSRPLSIKLDASHLSDRSGSVLTLYPLDST